MVIARVVFDELRHNVGMSLFPIQHVLLLRGRILLVESRTYPSRGKTRMHGRPLSDDAGCVLILVLLEPSLDVRRDELAFLFATGERHDWAKLLGYSISQCIVGYSQGG